MSYLYGMGYKEETTEGQELWSEIDRLQEQIDRMKSKQLTIREKIFKL